MKVKELMMGDWVTDGSQFPMYVAGIFSDCVYLDFEGNEGDVWEVAESDLEPIPITPEIMERNGFEPYNLPELNGRKYWTKFYREIEKADRYIEIVENKTNPDYKWMLAAGGFRAVHIRMFLNNIHELQHIMQMLGIENEIKL